MTNQGSDIKSKKKRGEWAELRFMARAAEHGLSVSKPWGDSERYDIGDEHNGQFLRVQVKSTIYRKKASYICNFRRGNLPRSYTPQHVDFLAAYVIPEDVWYIIPTQVANAAVTRDLCLSPHWKGHKYEPYKEAWHLLCAKPGKARAKAASAR